MKKLLRQSLLLCLAIFAACQNDPAPLDHESALPHNNLAQGSDALSPAEAQQLAQAQGKVAEPISAEALLARLQRDTTPLVALNFWKKGCDKCQQMQQNLQKIQIASQGKLKILALNVDEGMDKEATNLQFRSAGVTSEALLLSPSGQAEFSKLNPRWKGEVPALLLQSADGLQQFYQQDFTEGELMALLQPLML